MDRGTARTDAAGYEGRLYRRAPSIVIGDRSVVVSPTTGQVRVMDAVATDIWTGFHGVPGRELLAPLSPARALRVAGFLATLNRNGLAGGWTQ